MSVIHEERGTILDLRLLIFPGVVVLALSIFLFRLWVLQVVQEDELRLRAERMRSTAVSLTAPRGLIVDRKGRPLAAVQSQYVVTGIPKLLKSNPETLNRVAGILGVQVAALEDKLKDGAWRPNLPTPIHEGATSEQATRIVEDLSLEGVDVITQPTRRYTEPSLFTHVLGYVRAPDERDVARFKNEGLNAPEYVGKMGLEFTHDFALSGQAGVEEMTIDSRNRPLRTQGMVSPKPGDKLVLGLDLDLQRYAYELLGDKTGSIVAIEPRTGLVLAYVSKPSYDANLWLGGLSQSEYQALLNDPRKPLINRAIQTGYAPGSTFKIVTALASLLEGKFDKNKRVFCPGYYRLGTRRIRCLGNHGAIAFHKAFEKSCNTYFISEGMRAGPEALKKASELLGLGAKTGIDLLSESTGIIPSKEWKERRANAFQRVLDRRTDLSDSQRRERQRAVDMERIWFPGDTANFSIGQGYVLTTPIQLASMAAMVANRGVMYRPHFVREVMTVGGERRPTEPEQIHQFEGPEEFWNVMDAAMAAVIESGTARSAQIAGLVWGGKTGSAQNSRSKTSDSLFVGYAPIQNPRIAIAVVVENAGHGGEVAAPVAGRVVERFLKGPPVQPPSERTVASSSTSGVAR